MLQIQSGIIMGCVSHPTESLPCFLPKLYCEIRPICTLPKRVPAPLLSGVCTPPVGACTSRQWCLHLSSAGVCTSPQWCLHPSLAGVCTPPQRESAPLLSRSLYLSSAVFAPLLSRCLHLPGVSCPILGWRNCSDCGIGKAGK